MDIRLVDNARNKLDELKISLDSANAERRLRDSLFKLGKTRKKLDIIFGINMIKDAKYLFDVAAIEMICYGNTELYQGLVETLDIAEQYIGNISVFLCDVKIKSLENILNNISDSDFDKITKIDFGIPNIVNNILEK